MFKLSFKLLIARGKWVFLMIVALGLMISSVLAIFTSSETTRLALRERAYDLYGEHSGSILNADRQSVLELGEKIDIVGVGEYFLIDTLALDKGRTATIGWMDEVAIGMGRIQLLDGKFPESKNEVAIEDAYLELLDSEWVIGESRNITIQNQEIDVELVGVIKNYSSTWSVPVDLQEGVNDFPNIFISDADIWRDEEESNFLFKMDNHNDESKRSELLILEEEIVLNEWLFYKGLTDYSTISLLATVFQIFIIAFSFLSSAVLFLCFQAQQYQKIAIMKAVGAENSELYKISTYQAVMIFVAGAVLSIPIFFILYRVIIFRSFRIELWRSSDLFNVLIIGLFWTLLMLVTTVIASSWSIKKFHHFSINELLKRKIYQGRKYESIVKCFRSFTGQQLVRQLFFVPKQLALTVLLISLSILLVTLSFLVQREGRGIWNIEDGFTLVSQEIYAVEMVNDLTMLTKQRFTFSKEDVEDILSIPGVQYVQRTPLMEDVHPLIERERIPMALQWWIHEFEAFDRVYDDLQIVPNVRYILMTETEFEDRYPEWNSQDFADKVILYIPDFLNDIEDFEKLDDETLGFVRRYRVDSTVETTRVDLGIADVINQEFQKTIVNHEEIIYDGISIVLLENVAERHGLFSGYGALEVYLHEGLTAEEHREVNRSIERVMATIPGSLFQNMSEYIVEDSSIYNFLAVLASLSFFVVAILSMMSIWIVVFCKYQLQKRSWGIYVALGMNRKKIGMFLLQEMLLYFCGASIISLLFLLISFQLLGGLFPFQIYLQDHLIATSFLGGLVFGGAVGIHRITSKQSIAMLIRVDE